MRGARAASASRYNQVTMFSSRFHWDTQTNRLTQALAAKRAAGAPVLDLTESNPTHAGLRYPDEIVQAFADPAMLAYEPAPAGMPAAREAVRAYYAARGQTVPVDRILLTASTSEAYGYLFKLLCDPGDTVLVPRPSYPLFEFLADMESVKVRQYPLVYHGGWSIDLEALEAMVDGRTRAIVLVNPNNPTGSYVKRGELEALAALCARRGMALISDEVFADYALAPDAERVGDAGGRRGVPGVRHERALEGRRAAADEAGVDRGERSAASCARRRGTSWSGSPTRISRWARRCSARRRDCWRRAMRCSGRFASGARRIWQFAREAVAGSAANILAVEGGWYITLPVPRTRSEEEWTLSLLESADVLVQPGYFYEFAEEAYLVVSLLTAPEVFREGIVRLVGEVG